MVATCTAETAAALGLRLVIIQAEPVLEHRHSDARIDVAMRMTVKAGLWVRPARGSALGVVVGSRFNSLVN